KVLKKRTHDLHERVKELTCLYEATSLLRNPNLSERDVFQNLVELLPSAWQYPEAACARITINGNEYSTTNFRQSKWNQTSEIKAFGKTIGNIEVNYTEGKKDHFEGPFLKEERDLIDALAKHLCEFVERHISGKALRESEDRYRSLIENIPVVSWTSDSEGNTVFISPNVKDIYGYSEEEIIEAGDELWFSRIHPDDVERVKKAYAEVFDSNKEFNVEYRIKTKEGNWIWLLDLSTQTYELDGKRLSSGVFMDITQRKRIQDILKASEEEAQRYFNIVGSMILTIDHEGIVTRINRRGCEILGYEAEEIIGLNWFDNFIPMRDRAEIKEVHIKAMSGRIAEVEEYENPVLTKSGEEKLLAWRNVTLFDDEGNISGAISSAVDITDRNRTEKKLRTEMEFTEAALNSQRDTFFVFDPLTGRAIRWNKIFQQISEYSDEEIASLKANEATKMMMKDGMATIELSLITKSGKKIPFEYEASLMRVNDNHEYIVSVGRDMTERKDTEKAIKHQLDFIENVLESLSHPFYVIDVNDYTIKLANKVARLGDLEENPTCHFVTHRSTTPCSLDEHPCPLEEVKKTKRPVVVEHTHFDENDNVREMEIHAYPILDDNGNVVQMIEYALDITEHKQALKALEDNEKRFRELYENAPLGYQTLDERAYILNVNQAWLDALGYSLDEVVGKFFGNFLTAESKQTLESNFEQFKRKGCIDNIEYEMIRKDGSHLIARFNGRIAYDEDGNFKHTHCIFQDVTELKHADDLLRRQKEELSDLAHIMSHDLGNKMKNIRTLISLLKREPNEEVLERIDNLAQQTSILLQSSATLADSGRIVEEYESVDMNKIVQVIADTVMPEHIR
ncbi:MAG: PAS domain S-box protein, partial [Candidatus Thorarchaeota archaeon]